MPDEKDEVRANEEKTPNTPLHAHEEGRAEDIQGKIGGGSGEDQDADTAENTGGGTSGGPGGDAVGEKDPSNVGDKSGEPTSKAEGAKRADNPEPGHGTDEGKGGLGIQTGAAGGGKPIEPERGPDQD